MLDWLQLPLTPERFLTRWWLTLHKGQPAGRRILHIVVSPDLFEAFNANLLNMQREVAEMQCTYPLGTVIFKSCTMERGSSNRGWEVESFVWNAQ